MSGPSDTDWTNAGADILAAIDRYNDAPAQVQTAVYRRVLVRLVADAPPDLTREIVDTEIGPSTDPVRAEQIAIRARIVALSKTLDEALSGPAARIIGTGRDHSSRIAGAQAAIDEVLALVPDPTNDLPF